MTNFRCKHCHGPLRYAPGPLTFQASHEPAEVVAGNVVLKCDRFACVGAKEPNWIVVDLDELRSKADEAEARGDHSEANEIRNGLRGLGLGA